MHYRMQICVSVYPMSSIYQDVLIWFSAQSIHQKSFLNYRLKLNFETNLFVFISIAEPQHFYAAPAPDPTLLNTELTF
jgi:hypothetical protein